MTLWRAFARISFHSVHFT